MKKQHGLAVLAVAGGLIFLANTASAGSVIWTPPSSCSMLNCDATILHANITSSLSNPGGSIEPFVLQLHSSPQFCLAPRRDQAGNRGWRACRPGNGSARAGRDRLEKQRSGPG